MRAARRPGLWLLAFVVLGAPRARAGDDKRDVDLVGLIDVMRPLAGDPAWKAKTESVSKAAFEKSRRSPPPTGREAGPDGFEDGRILVAVVPNEGMQLVLFALRFETPEYARAHVAVERAGSELKDASMKKRSPAQLLSSTYSEGAGAADGLPGFRVVKRLASSAGEQTVDTVYAVLDRVVVQILVTNAPDIDRAAQDEALARAAAFVKDPAAAKALPPLEPRALQSKVARLTVRVLDGDGKPVPHAKALFTVPTGEHTTHSWGVNVEEGRGDFAKTVRGEGTIDVWGARGADGAPLPLAPARTVRVRADAGDVEVRLAPGVTIEGRVRTLEGKGAGGVQVVAFPEDVVQGLAREPQGSALTDADGAFRIVGLGRSPYRVAVRGSSAFAAPLSIGATGGDLDLKFVVRPGSTFALTVVDWEAKPAKDATVAIHRRVDAKTGALETVARERTGADGTVTFVGIDPAAAYAISVDAPAGRTDLVLIDERAWKPATGTLRLEHGFTVTGVVHDSKGAGVRAMVWRQVSDGSEIGVETEADGTFTLAGVPFGPVSLRATLTPSPGAPGGLPSGATVRVKPGDPPVVLPLGPTAAVPPKPPGAK